jgi:two-component sensor histidine kinase
VVDVTESKKAEFALKESEARLQQALAAGHVMAFEWDPRTGRSQRSDNTLQILGIELPQGDAGPSNNFLARVHPDDQLRFKAHVFGVGPGSPSYSIKFRFVRPDGREVWLEETAKAEFNTSGKLVRLKGLTRDITDLKRAEEQQSLLIAELDHRVKNTLACVSAIAQRSREGRPSMDEFLEVLDGRILSMANAHALLSQSRWQGVDLGDLIRCELAPCVEIGNGAVDGPKVTLCAEATQSLAMVLHELVTNAVKYGALSSPGGNVIVRWDGPHPDGDASGNLLLEWRERNGPPIVAASRPGYGTSIICDLIPYELGGVVDLEFAADGLRCSIGIPLKWIWDDCAGASPNWGRPQPSPGTTWPAAPLR